MQDNTNFGHAPRRFRIAGVVVLYNPGPEVENNIKTYINDLDILYTVDNSDMNEAEVGRRFTGLNKVVYLSNKGNHGIGHALNRGAEEAISYGADLLLTMDQDSRSTEGMIDKLLDVVSSCDISDIGIIAPLHVTRGMPDVKPQTVAPWAEVQFVKTSGNLLNLDVYCKAGPYMEELFIDATDNEYCLRLRRHGFRIVQVANAILDHDWGNIEFHYIFGKKLFNLNHPAQRWRYITRNVFYLLKTYRCFPDYRENQLLFFWMQVASTLLFEKNKFAKAYMMLRGYRDYRLGHLGPIAK